MRSFTGCHEIRAEAHCGDIARATPFFLSLDAEPDHKNLVDPSDVSPTPGHLTSCRPANSTPIRVSSLSRRAAAPSSFIVRTLIVQTLKSRTRFNLATGWPPGIPVASFTPPARATPEDASPVAHLSPPVNGALEGAPLVNPRDGRGGITVLELRIIIFRLLHAQSGRHSDVV